MSVIVGGFGGAPAAAVLASQGIVMVKAGAGASASYHDSALAAAIQEAAATGAEVHYPAGREYLSDGGVLVTDLPVRLRGNGARIRRLASTTANDKPILDVQVGFGTILSVTSIGQETILIDDYASPQQVDVLTVVGDIAAAGIAPGRQLRVVSDDYIPWGTGPRDEERLGESAEVHSVNAGAGKIYLFRRLRLGWAMTGAIRCAVHGTAVVDIRDVWFEDHVSSPITTTAALLRVLGASAPLVRGARSHFGRSLAIETQACVNHLVADCRIDHGETRAGSNGALVSYAYAVRDFGGTDGVFSNIYGRHLRHVFTTGAPRVKAVDIAAGTASFSSYGGSVGATLRDIVGVECASSPIDLHGDAYQTRIFASATTQAYRGTQSLAHAINLRGDDWEVIGASTRGRRAINIQFYGKGSRGRITGIAHDRSRTDDGNNPLIQMQGRAVFTASVSGTTMTVTAVLAGVIEAGLQVSPDGGVANSWIVKQLTGTDGGIGTYQLSAAQTVASQDIVTLGDPEVEIDGVLRADALATYAIDAMGVRVIAPRLKLDAVLTGANGGLIRSDSAVYVDAVRFSILAGSTITNPRLIRLTRPGVTAHFGRVKWIWPGGSTVVIGDHLSLANTILVDDLNLVGGTLGGTSTTGFTGSVTGSVRRANVRLENGTATGPNYRVSSYTTAGAARAIAFDGRGEASITLDITSSPTSGTNTTSSLTAPAFDGQMLAILVNAASTGTFTVGTAATNVQLAADVVLAAGQMLRLSGVGGKWMRSV